MPQDAAHEQAEISLIDILNGVLRRRKLVVRTALLMLMVTIVAVLAQKRTYTSGVSFIAQRAQGPSAISGLAAQFGIAVPGNGATESPEFYSDLVRTREVLGAMFNLPYSITVDTGVFTGSLYTLLGIDDTDSLSRRDRGVAKLARIVATNVDKRTSVVRVTVRTRWTALSYQIAGRLVDEVNRFNLARRRSQAVAEREFTEVRVDEVRKELRSAEDKLQEFLQTNRGDLSGAPLLTFQRDRLTREVGMRQQVYTTLSQAFEQAKIEAMRDTPVITVVEPPAMHASPDARGLVRQAILALVAGLLIGIVLAVIVDQVNAAEGRAVSGYDEFAQLRREALRDLFRPWRLI